MSVQQVRWINEGKQISGRVFTSYGAITVIFDFLSSIEVLNFQLVSSWMYSLGVGRVQTYLKLPKSLFFSWTITDEWRNDVIEIRCPANKIIRHRPGHT